MFNVLLACAFGGYIGYLITPTSFGFLTLVGIAVGALVGWLAFEPKKAWDGLCEVLLVTLEEVSGWDLKALLPGPADWADFRLWCKEFTLCILGGMTVGASVICPVWGLLAFLADNATRGPFKDMTTLGYLYETSTPALVVIGMFGVIIGLFTLTSSDPGSFRINSEFVRAMRWCIRRGNPICFYFYTLPLVILPWTVIFVWKIGVRAFRLIHSDERTICAFGGAIGATAGSLASSGVVAILVAMTIGAVSYRLIAIRFGLLVRT
ncbi:MAG: hypothetical protein AAB597_03715 [Patescibacteria group bacterium]